MKLIFNTFVIFAICLLSAPSFSQESPSNSNKIKVPAGVEYKTGSFHQWLWGRNYRKDWYTPVTFPIIKLDTILGGLTPVKEGGGNQTKSLQFADKNDKKYTLRTINKSLGKVLPRDFLGTFLEDIVDDQVSMSYPYGAPIAAYLAGKANVYHTNPAFYYVPKQPLIDTFREFGNSSYLFEQKLDGNWKEAANLGNFESYDGTFNVIDSLLEHNKYRADQKTYIKSRLFDMIINDWDRHEKQWEWGTRNQNGVTYYVPVPQDRDQAFYTYNGVLLSFAFSASGMKYFQPFKEQMEDVNTFNFEQRNLDRFFANEMTLSDWQSAAKAIQQALTNQVIDAAVKQVPAEVRELSAAKIATILKGRRDRLLNNTTTYYKFIAKEVDVPGSKDQERFVVNRVNDNETTLQIFAANGDTSTPLYNRTFIKDETNEIRIYGIGGEDKFLVTGRENDIKIRLIGGKERDSVVISGPGVNVYDNKENYFEVSNGTRLKLSGNDKIHQYKYAAFTYDKKGIKPNLSFNNDDFLYVGLGYGSTKYRWRKSPFAYKQNLSLNYSISQGGLSVTYDGLFPKLIGKWDLALTGQWDAIRWTNFFGFGNETKFVGPKMYYYRARSEQWLGSVGLARKFGQSNITVNGLYQQIRVKADGDRFTGKYLNSVIPDLTKINHFGGAELMYNVHRVNDSIIPTKGYMFWARAAYLQNLNNTSKTLGDFQANLRVFVPLSSGFSMVLLGGAQTVTGKPEFYQYASIGGGQTFRGLRLGRFYGKTAYYNNNTLRYMMDVKRHLYRGKFGFLTFFDNGRVWFPGETSNTIHSAYGGGILLAPFNKIYAEVTYGISDVEKQGQLRLFIPIK
ncbi:MAG: hypothetical protein LH478_06685 [Chitinophagaceae bacterium]|nr:hypothetical protein [Chitinophagaceae bacterium]